MPKLGMLPARIGFVNSRRLKPAQKQRDPIYGTKEYQRWRARVINRAGNQCEDPKHDPSQPRTGIKLYADHIEELTDGGAPFEPGNGMARCATCHGIKTIEERKKRYGSSTLRGSTHPDWLRPSSIPLHIVCGAPASGKTTWTKQRARPGDLVLDLDEIAHSLSGKPLHAWSWHHGWLDAALRYRNELLGQISHKCQWRAAWLIVSEPTADRREWWAQKMRPSQIVVLKPDITTCLARVDHDPQRAQYRSEQRAGIERWFATYQPREGDLVVGQEGGPTAL